MALDFDGAAGYYSLGSTAALDNLAQAAFAVSVWIYPTSTGEGGTGRIAEHRSNAIGVPASAGGWFFFTDGTASLGFQTVSAGGSALANNRGSANQVVLNTWQHVFVSYDDAGDRLGHIRVGGTEISYGTNTAGTAAPGTNAAGDFVVGNNADETRTFAGRMAEFAVWSRIPTADEIAALAAGYSPALFQRSLVAYMPMVRGAQELKQGVVTASGTHNPQPHPRVIYRAPIWVPVSAGGGAYSLTAESGSYALTGQAAGLLASRALLAEQGSYALTGQDVALNRGYVVAAEQGSYALTGQDAGLLRGLLLTAGQGSYDLTGQSVSLLWGRALVAEQGSYALNGQDASLVYTPAGAYSLAAGQGAYALTGQDVALLWSKVLVAAQGSYTITGQDAAFSRGVVLTAAQGSYTLTGQDAAFARAYALSAGYGSYALTGQIVYLTYSGAALEALEYLLLISHITQSMSKTSKVTMEVDLISHI